MDVSLDIWIWNDSFATINSILTLGAAPRGCRGANAPSYDFRFIYLFFYFFYFILFYFIFCLSAQRSVMFMMIIPLPHYDNFLGKNFEVGKKVLESPPTPGAEF